MCRVLQSIASSSRKPKCLHQPVASSAALDVPSFCITSPALHLLWITMVHVFFPVRYSPQISLPHMPPSARAWQITQDEQRRFPWWARLQGRGNGLKSYCCWEVNTGLAVMTFILFQKSCVMLPLKYLLSQRGRKRKKIILFQWCTTLALQARKYDVSLSAPPGNRLNTRSQFSFPCALPPSFKRAEVLPLSCWQVKHSVWWLCC